MSIYLTGSLAYDRIMSFSGRFSDSLLPDQLHFLNVAFFIERLEEKLGGTAGNIAYNMTLLHEKPIIISSVGKDFERYADVLKELDLPLAGINVLPNELTAGAYITTDKDNNQITAFHAAALMFPSTYSFTHLDEKEDIALVGPTNPQDMASHPLIYKEKGIRYIFDPGQQIPALTKEELIASIKGSYLLIGNDYEIQLVQEKTGLKEEDLINATTNGVIITLGAKGSKILEKGRKPEIIPSVAVTVAKDPTGAGDAYRAGLIKGLLAKLPLTQCAMLGTVTASFCVELYGTQIHTFTKDSFRSRYEETFGNGSLPAFNF